ncbi:MAG: hypothetical protein L3J42_00370, partial [Hydrogenimonas sp.]|nr:hypothetical protein [Hydrogenimonas sp.]
KLPRFPQFIFSNDVQKLYVISTAFNIDVREKDLYDIDTFNSVLGKCMQYIVQFLHKDLRPSDPLLENLEKLQAEKIEVEKRQMVRRTVADVLSELFKGDAIGMDEKKFVNLIMKKVA